MDGSLLLQIEDPSLICDRCYIDEAGTFMTMLDETRKQANIWSFEWRWEIDKPNPPKRRLEKVGEEDEEQAFVDDYYDEDADQSQLPPGETTSSRRGHMSGKRR